MTKTLLDILTARCEDCVNCQGGYCKDFEVKLTPAMMRAWRSCLHFTGEYYG